MLKESKLKIWREVNINVDKGYVGVSNLYKNSVLPKKRVKKSPLSKKDKRSNRELSSKRVFVEHIIGKLKIFKILSDTYRNRRKRFGLRFNLISGIYNFELKLKNNDF